MEYFAKSHNVLSCASLWSADALILFSNHLQAQLDPAKDKEFASLFLPLFKSIMQEAGIQRGQQLPIPALLADFGEELLEKFGPQLIADLYCNFNSTEEAANHREECLNRIQKAINPHEALEGIPPSGALKAIDSLSVFCADQLVNLIKELKIVKIDSVSHSVSKVSLKEAMPLLQDNNIEKLWSGLQRAISSTILQLFANHLEHADTAQKPLDHMMIGEYIEKLLSTLFMYTPEEEAGIDAALKIPSATNRKKALNGIFAERISNLLSVINPSQSQTIQLMLPLPQAMKELIWDQLRVSILPEFLLNIYTEKRRGQKQAAQAELEMGSLTGSALRSEACASIANFVSKFVPSYTKLEHQSISEDIYELVRNKLSQAGNSPDVQEIDNYLNENKEALLKELGSLMFKTSLVLDEMQPMTRDNIRSVLAIVFGNMTNQIDSFENPLGKHYDKDFLLKQGISLLGLIKDHLQTLNSIAKDHKVEVFHEVDNETLLKALKTSNKLHKGVAQSEEAIKAQRQVKESINIIRSARSRVESLEKFGFLAVKSIKRLKIQIKEQRRVLQRAQKIVKREQLSYFFLPLTNNLLELTGLKGPENLPFPSPLRDVVWQQLTTQILPNVLVGIFNNILDPKSLNQMIITALETYNAPKAHEKGRIHAKDPMQQKLDILCGELLQQMAQLLPNTFVKKAINFDTIKNISAEKLGQVLRYQLSEKLSVQAIIDMALPSLNKALKQDDFPIDDESLEVQAIKTMQAEEVLYNKASADMEATAHKAISELITTSIQEVVNKFIGIFDKSVRKVFGKHTNSVSRFFNWIGFRLIYGLIVVGLVIASTPFILIGWIAKKIFWACMDRHIAKNVKNVLKSVHMSVHEDLLYKLTESLIQSLKTKSHG